MTEASAQPGPGSPWGNEAPADSEPEYCQFHAEALAVHQCENCQVLLCSVCRVELPAELRLCPACATHSSVGFSANRKGAALSSFVFAGLATLVACAVLFSTPVVEDLEQEERMGKLLSLLSFVPAIIGLLLGLGVREKHRRSPPWIWLGIGWNGALVLFWIYLSFLGLGELIQR